uniref:Uncharacterized protein n=1 Tax=Anguilla anguilla TaxID=7936 RepID=A0A0E9W7I2_ANGAN
MKAVILFSLTLVLVSTKSIPHECKRIQLEEMNTELNKTDPKIFTNQFVPDVINYEKCTKEDSAKLGKLHQIPLGKMQQFPDCSSHTVR